MIRIISSATLFDCASPINIHGISVHQNNDEYTIFILIEGLMEFRLGNEYYPLKSQKSLLVFPGEEFSFCAKSNDIKGYRITFAFNNKDELLELIHEKLDKNRISTVSINCMRIIENIEYYTKASNRESAMSLAHLVSAYFYALLDDNHLKGVSNTYESYVTRSIEYMTLHISDKITVKDLSDEVGVCEYHFMRLFKLVTGITPMSYFLKLKTVKAAELLKVTNITITQIAEKLNFSSDAHFSRTFKKYMSSNPSVYRRQAMLVKERYTFTDMLLQTIIDSSPDLIFFKDRNFVLLGCNTAFSKVLGLDKAQIIGKRDIDLFPYREANFFNHIDRMIFESGNPQSNHEWMTCPDGTKKRYEVMKAPFYDNDHNIAGIVGISRELAVSKSQAKRAKA